MRDLLKTLCALPGVGGYEDAVREYIKKAAQPYADELREDRLGNLLVLRKGTSENARTIMLCAHMDEVGLLVRAVTDEGFLRFVCVGGFDRRVLPGKRVLVGKDARPGVIGLKAKHLSDEAEREKIPKLEELYIDAGFSSKDDALCCVSPGDYVTFDTVQTELGGEGKLLCSKAIDDRVGCAALLKLMEKRHGCNVWYVFSVQEEIGMRGAFGAAFSLMPDAAVVVEGTTAADIPSVPPHRQVCRPGSGVVIPFMDGGTIYNRELTGMLRSCADRLDIKWQNKEFIAGGTDAAAIQRTGTGCPVAAVAAAVRYIHTPSCVADLAECAQIPPLLDAFLNDFSAAANGGVSNRKG